MSGKTYIMSGLDVNRSEVSALTSLFAALQRTQPGGIQILNSLAAHRLTYKIPRQGIAMSRSIQIGGLGDLPCSRLVSWRRGAYSKPLVSSRSGKNEGPPRNKILLSSAR